MRSRYLVCYDVRDEARRRHTARGVEAFGTRLNYSVFVCDLAEAELTRLEAQLREIVDHRADSVLIVNLGPLGPTTERRFRWLCGSVALPESGAAAIV